MHLDGILFPHINDDAQSKSHQSCGDLIGSGNVLMQGLKAPKRFFFLNTCLVTIDYSRKTLLSSWLICVLNRTICRGQLLNVQSQGSTNLGATPKV